MKPAAVTARAMDVNTNQHDVMLNAHKVRSNFPFNARDPVPQGPKILHSVFRRIVDSVGDIEFRDVNGIVHDLDNFLQDKATLGTKFNSSISNRHQRHILLIVEIRYIKTFYYDTLKQFLWNLLTKHTVFTRQHTLGLHQVDVCSPGWFSCTNPTYYSKQRIKDDIYCHATCVLGDFSDQIKQDLAHNFSKYSTKDNKFDEIPEFHLVHRNIVGKGSQREFKTEVQM
jgi:hypothetical protein